MNTNWYELLIKPVFTPPAWVFAPAWIFLYILIGVSFVIFLKSGIKQSRKLPLIFFFAQLALNLIWSPVFFGAKNIGLALIIVVLLWITLAFTIWEFNKHTVLAAYLLIPYFLWVTFAAYLNAGIYFLN